jgi:hypothetical protein
MYTIQGKIWCTWHIHFPRQSTYATRTLSVGGLHTLQPFTSHQQHWMEPTAPDKKCSRHNPQHTGWLIHRSATQFLFQDNHWSSNGSQASVDNMLYQFTKPTPACDRYVQYLLMEANPSVLNRHKRVIQPWRCQLVISHSLTFSTNGPPLST